MSLDKDQVQHIAMLARLNPLGVVPAALFFAAVATGAETMSRKTGVPVFLASVKLP